MAKKYLDDTGMSYFWGKLKDYFQAKLVSGTNIKTINNETLLGSGDIALPSPADYIVEQGTSGIWTYRKWNSGIAECWGTTAEAALTYQAWGSVYEAQISRVILFPSGLFVDTPTVVASPIPISGGGIMSIEFTGDGVSASQIPRLYAVRPTAITNGVASASIHATGRWK